jgi:hypothetical protein
MGTTYWKLTSEVVADRLHRGDWRVEAFDDDGRCYVTIFSGPEAEERAEEYRAWLAQPVTVNN